MNTLSGKPFGKPVAAAIILLMLLLLGGGMVFAADSIGELLLVEGQVNLRQGTKSRIIKQKGQKVALFAGDRVLTASKSKANITLQNKDDGIQLYERSHFQLTSASPQKASVALSLGKALFSVFSSLRRGNFQVNTPTATIGVKGTEFILGSDDKQTFLLTINGSVGMRTLGFGRQEVIATANQVSVAKRNKPPTPPIVVPPATVENIVAEPATASFEAIVLPPPPEPQPDPAPAEEPPPEEEPVAAEPGAEEPVATTVEVAPTVDTTTQLQEVTAEVQTATQELAAVIETAVKTGSIGFNLK